MGLSGYHHLSRSKFIPEAALPLKKAASRRANSTKNAVVDFPAHGGGGTLGFRADS